ncbi:hypothetical protein M758_2G000600 [Ceratodon purpureus]|uniref:Uncharacterized protein n=1 Tax=Ceratodon purpureus TaxID=3225 RepID=A0A8T0INF2_CERPU|nr:hypothetical protein KC19_2G000800 [Ceratodon purpureus]KAG0624747.1 hypothetical protein M758_2G000600 [Ceratodon purpureus]
MSLRVLHEVSHQLNFPDILKLQEQLSILLVHLISLLISKKSILYTRLGQTRPMSSSRAHYSHQSYALRIQLQRQTNGLNEILTVKCIRTWNLSCNASSKRYQDHCTSPEQSEREPPRHAASK